MHASPCHELLRRLLPRPRQLVAGPIGWRLASRLSVRGANEAAPALAWLERALGRRGRRLERTQGDEPGTVCSAERAPEELTRRLAAAAEGARLPAHALREGYALDAQGGALRIVYAEGPGLQHALATLSQLIELGSGAAGDLDLPELSIVDWPDFASRGVLLDVSRDKVPTLETLLGVIDRLARWKLNQLQLYTEHTFAYAAHERVWRHASPLTPEEIRELDAHAAARHVELVPNQNSFGHMHRWLRHPEYRRLAECPDGFEHPWNPASEPYGLCATDPASLSFLEELYDELLPNFRSRQLNVGLDETLDLGAGRSRAACAARGAERVYLEFLKAVHERVRRRGRVMQFWADMVVTWPQLVTELPREALALEWGYEADHPFAEHLSLLRSAGLEVYVCPGTSSWNSFAGRTQNAIENIARAAREGLAAGAAGLLVTDWGDHGHLQPLSVSWLGLATGAALSWNTAEATAPLELDTAGWLDAHAFFDAAGALGRAARDLGNVYLESGSLRPNASVLFWGLLKPERLFAPEGVTERSLGRCLELVERAGEPLAWARPRPAAAGAGSEEALAGPLAIAELGWARDMLRLSCRLGLARCSLADRDSLALLPPRTRTELARELGELIERHRELWLARNRPGGLGDSAGRLERTLALLRG